jgi:hypothetical protein
MARVYPGEDFRDIYDIRGIYSSDIQGDDYKVRRTANDMNLDRRTNSEWQKQVIDRFSLASRIYGNKKPCWIDHFKRATKKINYAPKGSDDIFKTLTGYKLSINTLINSLKNMDGTFYNPECFCITPCDIFGDPMNQYSRLEIDMNRIIHYIYDEKKLTYDMKQSDEDRYDKFCSAVDSKDQFPEKMILRTAGCIPRDNSQYNYKRDIWLINKLIMWPYFQFVPVDGVPNYPFDFWDYEFFTYQKVDESQLPLQDGSMRGLVATLGYPYSGTSLCDLGNLQITIFYSPFSLSASIQYTNGSPFFDIYYAGRLLGRYGSGCGDVFTEQLDVSQDLLTEPITDSMFWNVRTDPVIESYQPSLYPPGKLQEGRLVSTTPLGDKTGDCMWDTLEQVWEVQDPVTLTRFVPNVYFKLNVWGYTFHDSGFQEWYPYGAFKFYASSDGEDWHGVPRTLIVYSLDGTQREFCFGHTNEEHNLSGDFKFFKTVMYTTANAVWKDHAGTMFGDPQCEPCELDSECFKPCNNQRGFFVLEKAKEFQTRDVSCRCPEDSCPGEFPISGANDCTRFPLKRCPENPYKVLLGDDCYPCIGPNMSGLVYDRLI